jgi:type I restriction enzyme, S subunit
MNTYPSYKTSGLDWIGEIPIEWDILRNKHLFYISKNLVGNDSEKYKLLSLTKNGVIVRDVESGKGKFPESFDTYQTVDANDLIFCLYDIDETPRTVGISEHIGMITGSYSVVKCNKLINEKFLYYHYLSIDDVKGLKPFYTGLRKVVRTETFLSIKVRVPPLQEQIQISNYLDNKTSKIDSLIRMTEKKIELLKEQRISIINKAVTKGLNPNAEMKDIGVEWIGMIPSKWTTKRMCYIFKTTSIKNTINELNLSVYRDYGVIPTNSRDDNHNVISEDISNYKLVEEGDFVMNKMKCWQGSLGLSDFRGIVSPSYTVMKPLIKNIHKYLHYLLRSNIYIPQYIRLSYGVRIGQWDLRFQDFRELPCLIPPIKEQQEIVDHLDKESLKIATLIDNASKRIDLLKEYRQSLISDVVTGKVDVRNEVLT